MGNIPVKQKIKPEVKEYQCVLMSKEGRYMAVRLFTEGLKLCAIDSQNIDPAFSVIVWKKNNQLAFKFKRSDKFYTPKVDGEALTLEDEIDTPDSLTENHWFEKHDIQSGEHYSLRSVVKPQQYLYIEQGQIFIRQTSQGCAQIRESDVSSLQK